jgi:phosphoglucosamine mutase
MRLFGTDGIRAPFGQFPLDQPTVTLLGLRLAESLRRQTEEPRVIIGGDTRDSTAVLCSWLAAGLEGAGGRALYGGVLPTPAIAALGADLDADAGIAVSASHNPHPDNGIKLFDRRGFKWEPAAEEELEDLLEAGAGGLADSHTGSLSPDPGLAGRYLDALRRLCPDPQPLSGLKMVVDCAHGAASPFAATLFRELGSQVIALGDRPDGRNINAGVGSTAPSAMALAVVEHGADLGVAFDGDADRAILADETGRVRDGDAMLFAWARDLLTGDRLRPPRIVATSMSNLGLERALAPLGVSVTRCDVGDRTVVATMRREGILLGGEQSGHLVHLGISTTGDGLVTALQMATLLCRSGEPLSALLADFRRFPQTLRNVRVTRKPELLSLPRVAAAAAEVERRLGDSGRLVLRYSGTEPLARVMIEGPDAAEIETLAQLLISAIQNEVGEREG